MWIFYLLLMLSAFAFSTIVSRYVSRWNDPIQVAFYRSLMTVSITFLVLYFWVLDNSFELFLQTAEYEYYIYTILLWVFGFFPYLCLLKALKIEKVSLVNPVTKLSLVITILFSVVAFGLILSWNDILFIAIALLWILLLLVDIKNVKNYLTMDKKALLYSICTMVGWGIFFAIFADFVGKIWWSMAVFLTEFWLLSMAVIYMIFTKKSFKFNWTKTDMNLSFLIWMLLAVWMISNSMALKYYDISIVSVFNSADVLLVVFLWAILFKENLSIQQIIGVLILVVGLIWLII